MADGENTIVHTPTYQPVLILLFVLIVLILLLLFLYKKLNKENNNEYTIRRIVYKEGGVRDQVRGAAIALGTRVGVQLWPQRNDSEEDGEEMQELQDEEGQMEGHSSQGSYNEEDEQEEDTAEHSSETAGKRDDTSAENSSLEGSDVEERTNLMDQLEEEEGKEERKGGDGEDSTGEASRGAGLQINLCQLSGSAIWSEEEGGDANVSNVTAL